MKYANQKEIVIKRDLVEKASGKLYLIAYQDNLINAMNALSPCSFKVYICLLFNKDKYSLDFSPQHIAKISGIHRDTARNAFQELEEKGYLVKLDEKHFIFYEVPKITGLKPYEEKREFVDDDSGEILYLTYKELQEAVGKEDVLFLWEVAKVYEPKTA